MKTLNINLDLVVKTVTALVMLSAAVAIVMDLVANGTTL